MKFRTDGMLVGYSDTTRPAGSAKYCRSPDLTCPVLFWSAAEKFRPTEHDTGSTLTGMLRNHLEARCGRRPLVGRRTFDAISKRYGQNDELVQASSSGLMMKSPGLRFSRPLSASSVMQGEVYRISSRLQISIPSSRLIHLKSTSIISQA